MKYELPIKHEKLTPSKEKKLTGDDSYDRIREARLGVQQSTVTIRGDDIILTVGDRDFRVFHMQDKYAGHVDGEGPYVRLSYADTKAVQLRQSSPLRGRTTLRDLSTLRTPDGPKLLNMRIMGVRKPSWAGYEYDFEKYFPMLENIESALENRLQQLTNAADKNLISLELRAIKGAGVQSGYIAGSEYEMPYNNLKIKHELPAEEIEDAVRVIWSRIKGLKPLTPHPPNWSALGWPFLQAATPEVRIRLRRSVAAMARFEPKKYADLVREVAVRFGQTHVWVGFTRIQTGREWSLLWEQEIIVGMIRNGPRIRSVFGGSMFSILSELRAYDVLSRIKHLPGFHHEPEELQRGVQRLSAFNFETDISRHDISYRPSYKRNLVLSLMKVTGLELSDFAVLFAPLMRKSPVGAIAFDMMGGLPSGSLLTAIIGAWNSMISHIIVQKRLGYRPDWLLNMGDDELTSFVSHERGLKYVETLQEVRLSMGFKSDIDEGNVFLWSDCSTTIPRQSLMRMVLSYVFPERIKSYRKIGLKVRLEWFSHVWSEYSRVFGPIASTLIRNMITDMAEIPIQPGELDAADIESLAAADEHSKVAQLILGNLDYKFHTWLNASRGEMDEGLINTELAKASFRE